MRQLTSISPTESALRHGRAFTLIEILLAISIATGMLIVALVFYRQAAQLRGEILQESERLATLRLVMDRIAGDLRAARTGAGGGQEFRGDASSLSFLTAALPRPSPGSSPGTIVVGADSVRVSISTVTAQEGTNTAVVGLLRQEGSTPPMPSLGFGSLESRVLTDSLSFDVTNRVVEPTTELIRYVRFRYWNGGSWQPGWTNTAPPPGVEIVLGVDPQPDDGSFEEYPYEQFRRLVYVPVGVPQAGPPAEVLGVNILP